MMKKLLCTLAVIFIMSCSASDCSIDSAKITAYAAEITEINQKIKDAKLESMKEAYRGEIRLLEAKIAQEADRCD